MDKDSDLSHSPEASPRHTALDDGWIIQMETPIQAPNSDTGGDITEYNNKTDYVRIEPTPFVWGTYGAIFKGEQITTDESVAVKIEDLRYPSDKLRAGFLEREHAVMENLDHPNIVKVRDIAYSSPISSPTRNPFLPSETGERGRWFDDLKKLEEKSKKTLFLTLDYIDGPTLSDRIYFTDGEPLSNNQITELINQIASAIDYLASKGIYHCDLNTKNIILTSNNEKPILIDFGYSNKVTQSDSSSQVSANEIYPPESTDLAKHDLRSEVFAFGVLSWELINSQKPFHIGPQQWLLPTYRDSQKIMDFTDKNNRGLTTEQIDQFRNLYQQVFDIDPTKRPQTATEFANRFCAILSPPAAPALS